MKKVSLLLVLMVALLTMGCENVFAPPTAVPPPPAPEAAQTAPEATTTLAPATRIYLVSDVRCDAKGASTSFTLYNPTDKAVSLTKTSAHEGGFAATMNGQPLRYLATYCGVEKLEPRTSVECTRSLDNNKDGAGFTKLGILNVGSSNENLLELKAGQYATKVTFECPGNKPVYAVTELSCSGSNLQFGVRNIFDWSLHLGEKGEESQYERLHIVLNGQTLDNLDESCGTDVLQPSQTANCLRQGDATLKSGEDASGLPQTNTVSVIHKLYRAETTFPCQ